MAIALVLASAAFPLHSVAAQGRIAGVVRDTTGAGIAGAQITIAGTGLGAESDAAGKFVLVKVPAGPVTVAVRRLGFAPASVSVTVQAGATLPLTVTVTEVAQQLGSVVVRTEHPRRYTGYLAGFYERRDRGFGHFITGDEIRKRDPMNLTDLFRSLPGMHVTSPSIGAASIRMRGNQCWPLVWLDGTPAAAGEFDLDALSPASIGGIEVYPGIAGVPPEFVMTFGHTVCGTIVIWSRQGERRPGKTVTAAELAELVASLQAYTADKVDAPVLVDSATPITPLYPALLYEGRVPGRVVVEFVVDEKGNPEMDTFGVVSSTDPRFTESVRRAVPEARFKPATLDGKHVPQVVRQGFTFVISRNAASVRQ